MGGKAGPGFSVKGLLPRRTEKLVTNFHILLQMAFQILALPKKPSPNTITEDDITLVAGILCWEIEGQLTFIQHLLCPRNCDKLFLLMIFLFNS